MTRNEELVIEGMRATCQARTLAGETGRPFINPRHCSFSVCMRALTGVQWSVRSLTMVAHILRLANQPTLSSTGWFLQFPPPSHELNMRLGRRSIRFHALLFALFIDSGSDTSRSRVHLRVNRRCGKISLIGDIINY